MKQVLRMRYELMRTLLVTIVIMGGILGIMAKMPEEAEAAQPVASITLDTTEEIARVGPGETGIVTFTGLVDVNMIGPGQSVQLIVVNLEAQAGWPATVSPATLYFTASQTGQSKAFSVTVKVPNFTSFTMSGVVTISGSVRTMPGTPVSYKASPAAGIITIKPYFMLTVSCEKPYIEVNPADALNFKLRIKNDGNTKDRVRMDITNMDELKGWVVTLGTRSLFLEEMKEDVINIAITSPQDWTLYRNRVTKVDITVKSETSLEHSTNPETQEYTFFIRDKGIYVPGFEPMFAIMALAIVAIAMKRTVGKRK